MISAVIFDLWNTLIVPGDGRFAGRLGRILRCAEDVVTDYLRSTGCLHRKVAYEDVVEDLWHFNNHEPMPPELIALVQEEHRDFVRSAHYIDGAEDTLRALRERGYIVGVVSNATSISLEVAEHIGLGDLVSDIRFSCITGRLKPDPRALLDVASEWGVDPEHVCMIGDKITTDVLGARLARMECVWFAPHLSHNQLSPPTSLLACVRDLPAILDALPAKARPLTRGR